MSKADLAGDFLGRNGDYIYYKVNGEVRKRKVPGKSFSKKVRKSPQFALFRSYGKIKGRSSALGKMIRDSLEGERSGFFDMDTHYRLSGVIHQAMLKDKERFLLNKPFLYRHATALAGFKFREGMNRSVYFADPYFAREEGSNVMKVPRINEVTADNYQYAEVSVLVAGYDFNKIRGQVEGAVTKLIPLKEEKEGFTISLPKVDLVRSRIYLIFLQIKPFELVNGRYVRLYNKKYQYLEIIDVMQMRSLK
ncbi:hypothetical protein [Anditalea andensis]|uniref:Uncharacterized protein n=1 Tax=Anditalea andensis TaxID=1048983 RepID=A0A074KSL4_9BACT|nr:hypothetical protein [Anditalea andensis]KEO72956.1 hypothetical protein EL17_15165 [Anditalea andensis]